MLKRLIQRNDEQNLILKRKVDGLKELNDSLQMKIMEN